MNPSRRARAAPIETARSRASGAEFIVLVALTTSLVAVCIDTMLPALGAMARELGASNPNDRQLVLSAFFGGMMAGLLVYGPLSDSIGRKPALFIGMGLFIAGNTLCAVAPTFALLLAGRLVSGFGAASPRIVAVAVVRDAYAGRSMARVMSFVSSVFILVPVLAPSFGQAVLAMGTWRHIFASLVLIACADLVWFWLRQPETLPRERRTPFSLARATSGALECFRHPLTRGYMIGSGIIFGAVINYLSTAQQIFQEQYGAGKLFPIYFGLLASGIGVASFVNGRLVMRFGMQRLSRGALVASSSLSFVAMLGALALDGHPPLWALLVYLFPCFCCNGILFGNFSARAMEPMGHIAGVASAVTNATGTLVALAIGTPFGRAYDGTVRPLVAAYLTCSVLALLLTTWAERKAAEP